MSIFPLPQFEADLEADRKLYEAMRPPTSVVVRFGFMKMVGEFPYDLAVKPGCGTKFVLRTHRGVEIGEMLTSTCPNAGCSKSVTRKEMLEYIENSGGKDYPFFSHQGGPGGSARVLRVATVEDLNEQRRIEKSKRPMINVARGIVQELGLAMKVVDAEPILGGERLTFYYNSEDRIDFREMVSRLAGIYRTRIEMRQIGARDEARLTADYERCGQHCCCKQFLKVLKPISMKAAKVQKATLDPLKISGRCGRLMCCLRYEDQTYTELAKRLPKRKSRVMTPEGPGTVLDGQILTQLVLVLLDGEAGKQIAVPVEELEGLAPGAGAGAPPPGVDKRPSRAGESGSRDGPRDGGEQAAGPRGGPRRQGGPERGPRERSRSGEDGSGPRPGPGRGDRTGEGRERRTAAGGGTGEGLSGGGPRADRDASGGRGRGPGNAGGATGAGPGKGSQNRATPPDHSGEHGPAERAEGDAARDPRRRRRRRKPGAGPGASGGEDANPGPRDGSGPGPGAGPRADSPPRGDSSPDAG